MRSDGIYLSRQADFLPLSHLGSPLLNFTEHLLYDRQYSKWLTTKTSGTKFYGTYYVPSVLFIINLIVKSTLQGWVLLLSPFYKREKWDTERQRNIFTIAQACEQGLNPFTFRIQCLSLFNLIPYPAGGLVCVKILWKLEWTKICYLGIFNSLCAINEVYRAFKYGNVQPLSR